MDDLLQLDAQFTAEEKLTRDEIKKFLDSNYRDKIATAYENGVFDEDFIGKAADMGLFGMTLPEQYGGANANYVSYGLACQELERCDSALRSFISVQSSLCMFPIFSFGSQLQKDTWLKQMAAGKIIGCFGLTEPDSGSDPASMKTTAKKTAKGWILNGSKMWITNATIADIAIVWANSDHGIQGFIVEKNTPGFSTNDIKHKMSLRASVTGELIFNNCLIPEQNRLPNTQDTITAPLKCLTQARYGIAWGAIGAASACFDTAVEYCKTRQQFNRPLTACQLIQYELAEMYTEILKAQTLNLQIGRLKDQDRSNYVMVSVAKMNACKTALKIARQARNLLGANGISLEYPVIRHMMNLESVFTYEGTDNIHHLIIGRHLTGDNAF